jgi:hypothetical protein
MEELTTIIFIVDKETGKHLHSVEAQYTCVDDAKDIIKRTWQTVQKKGNTLLSNFVSYLIQLYPVTFALANDSNKDYQAYCTVLVDAQNA